MKTRNYNLKLKGFTFLAIALSFAFYTLSLPSSALAQNIDPATWQQNATGLRTSSNADKKTAGLTTIIKASGIPFISLQGGVKNGGYGPVVGPTTIDLGEIKPIGTTPALISESADWSHNEMSFSNSLKVWISRLSPAVLIQNQNNTLRLFSGNLGGATTNGTAVTNRTTAPAYPKYIAYSSGGTIQVKQIPASGTTALSLPALDNNWILIWYGNNSHFSDTQNPVLLATDGYLARVLPATQAYLADAPMLLKFENNPASIKNSSEGGIDLTFSGNDGYTTLMPLFGRDHLKASDTESWGSGLLSGLPQAAKDKINFWNTNNRLCSYPTIVSETYAYAGSSDTSTISENISYLNVCAGGSTTSGFAILPPMLAIGKDALGANFSISATLTDAQYPTEFGPILGIDNANTYSYAVSGLKKYTDNKRIMTNTGTAPADLIQKLTSQVDKITNNGHYAPWIFADRMPHSNKVGDIFFLNPADVIYSLSEIAPVLPEPQKTNLINYIKSEKTSYPLETTSNLPLSAGIVRVPFALDPNSPSIGAPTVAQTWQQQRPEVFLKRVSVYNSYALSRYYDLTGETVPAGVYDQAKTILNNDLAEQDWATFSWFKGFNLSPVATVNTNRYLNGLIGFVKLAKASGDSQAENLGRSLLAKAAIERLAMAKYPRYLYNSGLTALPASPTWMPQFTSGNWFGFIWNYNWIGPFDDVRQVVMLDQFGIYLFDQSGYFEPAVSTGYGPVYSYITSSELIAYRDLAPEAFRFLTDFAKADLEIYLNKVAILLPHWYTAYSEAILANEHNVNRPIDSFQLFMAKVFIQNDTPANLKKYTSFPWLDAGDLFYVQKLAETVKAYQGWAWSDTLTGPCTISSLSWSASTAAVNTPVNLTVQTSGDCSKASATFEVGQNGIGGGKMTDPTPKTSSFVGSQAQSIWTTQFTPVIPFTNPQYSFKVSLDNGTTWSNNSSLLTVTQTIISTPTPTPTPTSTPTAAPATINLNSTTKYQTINGWEVTGYIGEPNSASLPYYRDALLDQAVNDIGINRIRLEVRSGFENQDYWTQYYAGQITYANWRCLRYSTVNDNSDHNNINWSGFNFSSLDWNIDNVVLPMKQRVEARGEKFYVNLNYVAFTGQIRATGCDPTLQYIHNDPNEYAEFILATYQHIQQKYGFVPDTIEVILEPDNVTEWNNGTIIGNAIMATITKLEANGFTPRFVVPSTTCMQRAPTYFDAMRNVLGDTNISKYIKEFSYHRYCLVDTTSLQQIASRAMSLGINTSMLEWWDTNNTYNTLHQDLTMGRNSAWQQATVKGLLTVDTTNPTSPVITVPYATRFTRQYFKFIRSGAQRIETASANANFDPVAFINKNGTYVVVVRALAGGNFSIGDLPAGTYGIKYTTPNQYNIDEPDQTITSGQTISTNIPATGVITIYDKNYLTTSVTPTPSPSPTPGQIACSITSVSWPSGTASVAEGTDVNISVSASGSCSQKQVHLTVRRNITLQPDVDALNQPTPRDVDLTLGSGNTATASAVWKADNWTNACLIGSCDPTFFAKGQMIKSDGTYDTEVTTDRAHDLKVTNSVITPTSPTDWPQVQKDPQHTGYSAETLGTNFKVAWTYPFQPDRVYPQTQAIVYQGKVFVGTEGANGQKPRLIAINAGSGIGAGQKAWEFTAGGPIVNSVAADNNKIFFGSMDGAVYAIDSTSGQQIWKQQLSQRFGFSTAPVVADNKVMIGGRDGYFYALNPADGTVLWKYNAGSPILMTAAWNNKKAYFGTMDMYVHAVNTVDGSLAWKSSQKLAGLALKDYWPVVTQGKVLIRTWSDMNSTNFSVLDETTGIVSTSVPQNDGDTMNGATTPTCVLNNGKLFVPANNTNAGCNWQSGWGLLDLSTNSVTPLSNTCNVGSGNTDENINVTCSANLLFAMHTQEANANYTGTYDLNAGSWKQIGTGHKNNQMSSNTQGGGGNPASISSSMFYHISWHELIARTTQ